MLAGVGPVSPGVLEGDVLATVGKSGQPSGAPAGPVWQSARGASRRWQGDLVVADAFWQALDGPSAGPAPRSLRGPRRTLVETSQFRFERANQTVTEQIAAFLASRGPGGFDLELVGTDLVAGRLCDLVETVPAAGQATFRLWVDHERLAVLRAVKLVDGVAAEIIEFLDIAFVDGVPEGAAGGSAG
jgi:hypothetical protein